MKSLKGFSVGLCILAAIGFVLASAAAGATPEDKLKELYQAAKADKEVIFQTSGSVDAMDPVAKAFRKQFPDIKLSIISIGSTAIGTRLIAEAGAKRISVDVGTSLISYVLPLTDRDLLVRNDWVKEMGVSPALTSFENRFIDYSQSPRIWIYNTKQIKKEEAPKSWKDLLDPKWKGGKIGVRAAPSGFSWMWPEWKKDKEKVIAFLKEFEKQEVVPGKRDAMVTHSISNGEYPIGVVVSTNVFRDIEKGAPIAITSLGPSASDPGVMFIPKGAPHPNAAKFLTVWLSSKEGVQALLDCGYGLAYPPEAGPQAKMLADNNIGFMPIKSPEDLKEYAEPFSDTVMKIMKFMPE